MSLDVKNLTISDHAVKRAKERFKRTSKTDALNYCKSILGQPTTKYIGIVASEDGGESHLYSNGKIDIHLSTDYQAIKTVILTQTEPSYHPKIEHHHPLKHKLIALYQKEISKCSREEINKSKRIHSIKMDYSIELAELNYRAYKTRSQSVRLSCEARMRAIKELIKLQESELNKIKSNKRIIARAMTTLI